MNPTYTVRVLEVNVEEAREITVQRECPLEAVVDGLEQLHVESLERVSGIEIVEQSSSVE
jgi:hypothetical protein